MNSVKKSFLVSAVSVSLCVSVGANAQTTIKVSHFLPPSHFIHDTFIEPWTQEVEECAGGEVKFQIFPGGSAFGNVAKQLDQVKAGVVDIAHGLSGVPRGRLPRTNIIDMPFLVKSSDSATRALWDLYQQGYIADDFKGLKVLALHAHNAGLIHTRDKRIDDLSQLQGLRIRFPSVTTKSMLESYGASAIGMPPTQVYENLSKGAIDGTVFPWDAVGAFKLDEVLKYHLDAKAYTTSFFYVMNERKYNMLPEKVRGCIDTYSGQALIDQLGGWWNDADKPGYEAAVERGNEIIDVSDEQRQRWREQLEPVVNSTLESLKADGVEDPQGLYDAAQKAVANYE